MDFEEEASLPAMLFKTLGKVEVFNYLNNIYVPFSLDNQNPSW
jgi:hypothetical protein